MRNRHVLLAIALAALPLAGCGEADAYPLPINTIKNRLSGKVATYDHKGNEVLLRFERGAGDTVAVALSGKLWIQECTILLEAVDENSTQMIPDCGKSDNEYHQETLDAKKPMITQKAKEILEKAAF